MVYHSFSKHGFLHYTRHVKVQEAILKNIVRTCNSPVQPEGHHRYARCTLRYLQQNNLQEKGAQAVIAPTAQCQWLWPT
jgi:hypothetical protein